MIKYTRDELMKMPLKIVRNLDIRTIEEERLIQDVVSARETLTKPIVKFKEIIPDIKTKDQENVWQGKIDKFKSDNSPIEAKIVEAEKQLVVINEKITETVIVPTVITVENGQIIKPFCDKCSSKGVRHKKECALYVPTVKQNADKNTNSI